VPSFARTSQAITVFSGMPRFASETENVDPLALRPERTVFAVTAVPPAGVQ
jgi:hypothetical protein